MSVRPSPAARAVVLLFAACLVLPGWAAPPLRPGANAIASAHPAATDAGLEVLAAGGNAFDAAVAVSAALAVVEPTGSGLGGGGFWLLHRASDGMDTFVDGREKAPLAATRTMYQDAQGNAVAARSRDGALAAAIPGEPAALVHIAQGYGRLPLAGSLAPAIRLAREGFACDDKLARTFEQNWSRLSADARRTFAVQDGPPPVGAILRQPELARTLQRLADQGAPGFYEGETARLLLDASHKGGGIWSAEDLARYRVVEREPMRFFFRDVRIVTAPPPSAGGVTLAEMLQQLEVLNWTPDGAESKHLAIEAMRRAYRDRAAYLGDPDFVRIPLTRLTSRSYAESLAATISRTRATPSKELPPAPAVQDGMHTTHLSVLDADGNRVAATLSINLSFGSGYMAPGTGVFLNDEMDDFAASTTAQNAYGLIGSEANAVAGGKRPLSSMTPTFAEGPKGLLIIGTPGGSRIITMVLLGLLDWVEGADAGAIVALPRYHHQFLPDRVEYEPAALDAAEQTALAGMGHVLRPVADGYGNMQVVTWSPQTGEVRAAADPRGVGEGKVVPVVAHSKAAQR